MDIGQRGPYKDASPKIDFIRRFATLGGFGGEGLYLSYYPLQTKALAEKTLLHPSD